MKACQHLVTHPTQSKHHRFAWTPEAPRLVLMTGLLPSAQHVLAGSVYTAASDNGVHAHACAVRQKPQLTGSYSTIQ
jgi:hypothetical protein